MPEVNDGPMHVEQILFLEADEAELGGRIVHLLDAGDECRARTRRVHRRIDPVTHREQRDGKQSRVREDASRRPRERADQSYGDADQQQRTEHVDLIDALLEALREQLMDIVRPVQGQMVIDSKYIPFVVLVVGVNGAGKTTTIGKLARIIKAADMKVMLAAGDTFRAAAVEQLQVWGQRNDVPVIAQATGADPAAVAFDALQSAQARKFDVLIADTAGRLHTQSNLMEELKKVKRVMGRLDPAAPHEVLLVLDASQGQNALQQAKLFHEALGVTGIVLTKLDGTAKGGIVFAIASELKLPIRYLGVGESVEDFVGFEAAAFVDALLKRD